MQAGCFVADGRINGSLNLSRALGDFEHKQAKDLPVSEQAVTAMPDVLELDLEDGIEFMVRLATNRGKLKLQPAAGPHWSTVLTSSEGCLLSVPCLCKPAS